MKHVNRFLPGVRVQWGAWLLALALHVLVLCLLGPLQPQRPVSPPAVVMAVVQPLPVQTPVQPEPTPVQAPPPEMAPRMPPVSRPAPVPEQVLASAGPSSGPSLAQAAPAHTDSPAPPVSPPAMAEPASAPAQAQAKPAAPVLRPATYQAPHLNNPKAEYPLMSRRAGESGRVMIEAQLSAEARLLSVKVFTSSGYPRLDMAAVEAVRNWRFEPAREGERAVASQIQIPIEFTLE